MPAVGLSLPGLVLCAGGLVLCYSGLNDPEGGPVGVVRDVLQGKTPTPGAQKVTPSTGTFTRHVAGEDATSSGGAAVASGSRGKIISVARSYLGIKYVFGGMSRSGVDCSGLVAIAYRDGAGVKLPHKATLQMARGRRISREQIQPGDLVGWGSPGNYPHIALALNTNEVIVAPHTGTVVQIQKLWTKKVPGFGYPDIVRILGD